MRSLAFVAVVVAAFVGCRGRVPVVEGEGDVVGEGEGDVVGEGEGEVVCVGLSVRCGDRCVDVQADDDNCGVCGDVCADDERCTGGRCNARCVNPRLDLDGEFVGTFPELVGCRAARYDVDGDGSIDDVCGAFRVDTEPAFGVVDFGVSNPFSFAADVHPAPGLEHKIDCKIVGADNAALLDLGPAPCELAGSGFSDLDDDGDFDVVMKDGRVFAHNDDGLVPGEALPPIPGAVTHFRFGDDGRELLSFDSERGALVHFHDGVWVAAGPFASRAPDALYVVDDGTHQTLVIWQNVFIIPNLTLCSWGGTAFSCHLAATNAGVVASPPRDGRFSFDTSASRVSADGHELFDGLPRPRDFRDTPERGTVALGLDRQWLVSKSSGDVFTRRLRPQMSMPVSARVHRGGSIVDVRVDDGAVVVGGNDALPIAGTPRLVVAHPTAPVVWLALNRYPTHATGLVVALNVETGDVLTETEIAMPFATALLQFVSNGDTLELRVSSSPTLAFDATTGALLEEGSPLLPSLDDGHGVVDLDGDGVADDLGGFNGVITTSSGSVDVGYANVVFGGPGRRQVSMYSEGVGAVTWDLLCD